MPIQSLHRLASTIILSLLLVATSQGAARGDSALDVIGPGVVVEASHRIELAFGAKFYEVEETIVLANRSKDDDAYAKYTFDLPARSGIVGVSVETATGARSTYALVGAKASTRLVSDPVAGQKADMGLVRLIGSEGSGVSDENRYELRVFPIPRRRTTTVKLTWNGTVRLVGGSYSLRIPDRGEATNLARTEVVVTTMDPMTELYGGDTLLAKRSRTKQKHQFFAPVQGDLLVQGRGKQRAQAPRAEVALFPLTATSGVAAVRVMLPDAAQSSVPAIDRALFIIDTSSSMTAAGIGAASKVVDGLFVELGSNTRVEAVLYERGARVVLGGFRQATRDVRASILREIRSSNGGNGSNLGPALERALQVLMDDSSSDMGKTLIVIISDGMVPTTLTGDAAADALGARVLSKANILTAVLVPPNAPLPDVQHSTLGDMVRRGRGRIVSLRHSQANQDGSSLLRELGQPAPLDTMEIELSSGDWVGSDLPGSLLPGSSIAALGFYQGKPPKRIIVRGMRAGVPETLVAAKLKSREAKVLATIAIANASPFGMPGINRTAEESQQDLRNAAAKLGVVTRVSAGVAVPANDGYAADRIRSAKRWGMQTYRRLPAPPERRASGKHFTEFRQHVRARARVGGRTGFIDKKMISRRVKAHVIPQARRCYEKLLRRNQEAKGALRLHIEMARGEVLHASIPLLPPSLEPIRSCIEDAMYAMPVPIVRQGQAAELVSVAKYPLRFRRAKEGEKNGAVEPATLDHPRGTDNPLLGLPD
ncbi:MAG: VWA domain-containing protein [Myxococcales bacterium]|nr:VWA domain-containing protein [Myxococcales bacterium]